MDQKKLKVWLFPYRYQAQSDPFSHRIFVITTIFLLVIMQINGLLLGLSCLSVSLAQLADNTSYPIGPQTTTATKWNTKVCDITNYGAVADGKTDAGPAILSAFNACSSGGVVSIPLGTFALDTWVRLSGGKSWAINLDGIIVRTGTAGGNMIYIEHSTDFEIYSSHGEGAIQGYGYQFHSHQREYGPRILRLYNGKYWFLLRSNS